VKTAGITIAVLSVLFIGVLLTAGEPIILLFVEDDSSAEMVAMATEFVAYVWPLFLFAGTTMLTSGYLTAIHLPFQSGVVAMCHGLILPAGFFVSVLLSGIRLQLCRGTACSRRLCLRPGAGPVFQTSARKSDLG
jgi:Na+-driven multidrug efflux pump